MSMLIINVEPGTVTVLPPAEIDLATVWSLRRCLADACAMSPARVVVDFSQVTFCDIQALRVLVDAAHTLLSQGCRLEICQPTPLLRRLAELTDTSRDLNITLPT